MYDTQFVLITTEQHEAEMAKISKTRLHYENLNMLNGKRKDIKQFGKGLKENPTRRSSDITDQEVNVAAQILQLYTEWGTIFFESIENGLLEQTRGKIIRKNN